MKPKVAFFDFAAGGEADDQADRLVGIGLGRVVLRQGARRIGRQQGSRGER